MRWTDTARLASLDVWGGNRFMDGSEIVYGYYFCQNKDK